MPTRNDLLQRSLEDITKMHAGNISALWGIGSFFSRPLEETAGDKVRTIDIIALIDDLDIFYDTHKFEGKFSVLSRRRGELAELNHRSPLYIHKDNYRMTIIPFDLFNSWTSKGSPVGYFVRGRMQKPLKELMISEEKKDDLDYQFANIRREAIEHTFRTIYKPITLNKFYERLCMLSYLTEGMRGWEAIIFGKHKKIFDAHNDEIHSIYAHHLLEYARENKEVFKGLFNGALYPTHTKEEAQDFIGQLKMQKPYYARVLMALQMSYPDPKGYFVEKASRIIKFDNMMSRFILNSVYNICQEHVARTAGMEPSNI
ncbi:hypothetical protein H6503_02965 [Candidatus Woesearchaeota archaeon]|nr:hypothetical protein [Candidatus Woesearchaeota archaeon]